MNNLVILTGPTAVGKTSLSINLAKAINGEIISADSMQVYKGMDIGTAKIKESEMRGVPHHLIDIIPATDDFNVARFKELAKPLIENINDRGKIPIICGGTGFYIQALIYDIDFNENEIDLTYRSKLEDYANNNGNEALHDMLKKVDPESAESIPAANKKRVIRALEYYNQTGEKFSIHNAAQRNKKSPYNFAYFVLNDDRALLYNRIDLRVDRMIENGLLEEVKRLVKSGAKKGMTSMDAIGYKELLSFLANELSWDEAIYLIKKNSRNYAKRQLTWFRREREVIWLDKTIYKTENELLDVILSNLKTKGIL